jgi:hypothetical protein
MIRSSFGTLRFQNQTGAPSVAAYTKVRAVGIAGETPRRSPARS